MNDTVICTRNQLRYLCIIYELAGENGTIRSKEVAAALGVTRVSVANMTKTLVDEGFLEKEQYGAIHLKAFGEVIAHRALVLISHLEHRMPQLGLRLSPEEVHDLAFIMACALLGCDDLCASGNAG